MTTPPAPVIPQAPVTILDVYTEQIKLGAQLSVIHEQLKAIPDHEARIRTVEAVLPPNLEARLGSLETTKAKMIGAAVAVSALVSALGTWVGIALTRH